MAGTELAYGAFCLRACYEMPVDGSRLRDLLSPWLQEVKKSQVSAYVLATRCPVLTCGMSYQPDALYY
eukprot:2029790-Rhodomonas_salina.2